MNYPEEFVKTHQDELESQEADCGRVWELYLTWVLGLMAGRLMSTNRAREIGQQAIAEVDRLEKEKESQ